MVAVKKIKKSFGFSLDKSVSSSVKASLPYILVLVFLHWVELCSVVEKMLLVSFLYRINISLHL